VTFDAPYPLGTIIIRVHERQLYLMVGDHQALRYRVAVGQQGKAWRGAAFIKKKYVQPAWMAPSSVLRDHPTLPHVIAAGAPNNPMGARALELNLSEIAIHGTAASMRASIGSAASYGCIRMLNEDIIDLYPRVNVGTLVISEP
jgi:lipoprotein-anchoring transpeptidase ErfK/SrfK